MDNKIKKQELINKPIQPTLKSMKLYDKELFAIEKLTIVRTTASTVALTEGMKFRTKQNNPERVIEVTRIG
jgi:hypothetical protein